MKKWALLFLILTLVACQPISQLSPPVEEVEKEWCNPQSGIAGNLTYISIQKIEQGRYDGMCYIHAEDADYYLNKDGSGNKVMQMGDQRVEVLI